MDSTHVKANASGDKREVVTVVSEPREYIKKLEADAAICDAEKHGVK